MKSIQPKITVSDDDLSLLGTLGIDEDEFAQFAFDEWIHWLSAENRPTTLSEQEVDRLYRIIAEASSEKDLTIDRLIRDYKLPEGRARFLRSAVRRRYPQILAPEIDKLVQLIKNAEKVDDGHSKFRIVEDDVFLFREVAKTKGWGVDQLKLERRGLGQYNVIVRKDLKDGLTSELGKYK
jgi:hypothetical protein